MKKINAEEVLNAQKWRYAVKKFDPQKKIDDKTWKALEETLVLTPSSYGLQPWKFIVVTNQELKDKLRTVSWNQSQVSDCSHLVVFVAKEKMDEAHVEKFIQKTASVRGLPTESLDGYKKMMISDLINGPRGKTSFEWAARQIYIALGNFMTASALLEIDTCPLEGLDPTKYDELLGITGSGWKTVCACPAGHRSLDDKYSLAKKVRFESNDIFIYKK